MIKIGIMTLYSNNNFGAAMQAFALQYILKKNGFDCEDIKYQRDLSMISNNNPLINTLYRIKMSILHPLFILHKSTRRRVFVRFVKQNIVESKLEYDKKSIKDSIDSYNMFVCGSDNIWNKNLLDTSYLLDFVPDKIGKIAYAPGMSTTSLSNNQAETMIPLINRIDFLSCRERIGCELIKKLTDREVFHAMDPTLLLHSDVWKKMINETKTIYNGDYIFALVYGNSNTKCNFINSIGKYLNMDIVTVPYATGFYNKFDCKLGTKRVYDAGPLEILSLINNAKLIITDTFHATVFSILFKKNFIALRRFTNTPSEQLDYRIDGLLEKLGISNDHILDSITDIDYNAIIPNEIDYNETDVVLEKWRKESTDYLLNSVRSFEKQE